MADIDLVWCVLKTLQINNISRNIYCPKTSLLLLSEWIARVLGTGGGRRIESESWAARETQLCHFLMRSSHSPLLVIGWKKLKCREIREICTQAFWNSNHLQNVPGEIYLNLIYSADLRCLQKIYLVQVRSVDAIFTPTSQKYCSITDSTTHGFCRNFRVANGIANQCILNN